MISIFSTVGILHGVVMGQVPAEQPSERPQSVYVQRMMSLDRDADGFLSANELPGKLVDLLKHDANGDKRLDTLELSSIEQTAMTGRDDQNGKRGDEKPIRRNGRNRNAAAATPGSPFDPEQILRFALTFDADKDGGLDAAELNRYARALASRRAKGRRRNDAIDPSPRSPKDRQKGTAPKGLGDPSVLDDPALPFGSPPAGAKR